MRILLAFMSLLLAHPAFAAVLNDKFSYSFDRLPIQQFVMLFYDQCETRALILDPSFQKLDDFVSLKTPRLSCSQMKPIFIDALARSRVAIYSIGLYDLVKQMPVYDEREGWSQLIYQPRWRDALDLAELSSIVVKKGEFAHRRRLVSSGSEASPSQSTKVAENGSNGASLLSKPVRELVFFGPPSEVAALKELFARLDVPSRQLEIRAGVYEFQKAKSEGSAINAVLQLFKSRVAVSVPGGVLGASASSFSVAAGGIDFALSLLDSDSRFRFLSRPKFIVSDGEQGHFFAGEDLRVAGAAVPGQNGTVVQSKETLSAGVTLDASVKIMQDVVDVRLYQAVSNFVSSSAGGDPSVLKRELRSHLFMKPGEVYVIGGLQSSRSTQGSQRLFGARTGSSGDDSTTEVVLLLSVNAEDSESLPR